MKGSIMSDNNDNNTVQKPLTLTDVNWAEEIEQYQGLSLVDVWAPWCGPCRIIGPVVEDIAQEFAGRLKVGKLNADENAKAMQLGVSGIPTLLIFRNGQEIDRIVGAVPKPYLVEKINYHLGQTVTA